MPYFPKQSVLYIHIPKTGGTSIEKYFAQKEFQNKCNQDHIVTCQDFRTQWWIKQLQHDDSYLYSLKNFKYLSHSAQHMTVKEIKDVMDISRVKRIIVSVRDPYTRFLSDLMYVFQDRKYTNIDQMVEEYERQVLRDGYNAFDNHARPQHNFIEGLDKTYDIVKCETLTYDMQKLGYKDFDEKENTSNKDYTTMITPKVREYVLKHYKQDFIEFGYKE